MWHRQAKGTGRRRDGRIHRNFLRTWGTLGRIIACKNMSGKHTIRGFIPYILPGMETHSQWRAQTGENKIIARPGRRAKEKEQG